MSIVIGKRLAVIVFGLASQTFAAEPGRDEFAYHAPIEIKEAASIYRAPLTLEVYQALTRADLRDLRVYNGDGEVVPHGIRRPTVESGRKFVDLALFPVPLAADGAPGDISMFVATAASGSVIALKTAPARPVARSAYVVDASQTVDGIVAVELGWADSMPDPHFVGVLAIEASEDLRDWRAVGQGAVANLSREGQTLVQRRIVIPPQRVKYLRLTWTEPSSNIHLTAVKVELHVPSEPQRDWLTLDGDGDETSGEYRYEMNGKMPVDRARVPLSDNGVARVSVWSRHRVGDPWVQRGQKTVFAVVSGAQRLQDNEIPLQPSGDRYWLLRFDGQANGLGRAPTLQVGWMPHQLVFVKRGSPPFVLAFGSSRVSPSGNYGIEELLQRSGNPGEAMTIGTARLGTADAADRAHRPGRGVEWRQWLLWGVLLVGVGGLVWLAVRLGRQLSRSTE